jgi:Secretion system C-terminal sorting domain
MLRLVFATLHIFVGMKRSILFTAIAFITIGAFAQSWCPPGAEWVYRPPPGPVIGYSHVVYEGDTIVGGRQAQILSEDAAWYDLSTQSGTHSFTAVSTITSVAGGVVSSWGSTINGWEWDTLYVFDAIIGDHWNSPHTIGEPGWLEVLDTSHVIEDGVPLRVVDLGHMCFGDTTLITQITERRGGPFELYLVMPCTGPVDDLWTLTCYRDVEVGPPDLASCIPIVPLDVPEVSNVPPTLFPNPGTDQFTLDLSAGPHLIILFDALGRAVLRQRTTEERATIGTAHLPSGIYTVRVDADPRPMHWVKE